MAINIESGITITDMFCGAGGGSIGAEMAGGISRIAINHSKRAIETHNTNFPNTDHILTDLHTADPRKYTATTILLASPECTNHALAKGKKRKGQQQLSLFEEEPTLEQMLMKEAEDRSRCTMWTPPRWAEQHQYPVVILENVVDVHLWAPFDVWLQAWRSLDYEYEFVNLNSMFCHPTPQTRDRLYFVAWKKGIRKPDLKICPLAYCRHCGKDVPSVQSWKNPAKKIGKYNQQYVYRCPECAKQVTPYYHAAANAIEWSLPTQRIGDRPKPLTEKTMQRIAYGLQKFQFQDGSHASVPPYLVNLEHSECRPARVDQQPFPTQTCYDATGLAVPPFILDHIAEYRPRRITDPLSTVVAGGNHQSLIMPPGNSYLMTYYNNGALVPVQHATPTVTTLERHALVVSEQRQPSVEDCGFRMLTPGEIKAVMAFPKDYIVTGNRREQVKQLGNAVTPPVVELLMKRVMASLS